MSKQPSGAEKAIDVVSSVNDYEKKLLQACYDGLKGTYICYTVLDSPGTSQSPSNTGQVGKAVRSDSRLHRGALVYPSLFCVRLTNVLFR